MGMLLRQRIVFLGGEVSWHQQHVVTDLTCQLDSVWECYDAGQ